ncbi:protein wech [Ceratitis capitata]|uniref:(Mediterranean fruit fly) hypothetical protein n=1 Tax=Ceratitis capitata TaxID=7213 RepID=A0A811VF34_CERCA|nr:protein wech [Ceratitis capitata]XP_020713449.1 protein wech [Ceratitis capitata]CAD7013631.1 unnamed protein product [Ceratitis capitata]
MMDLVQNIPSATAVPKKSLPPNRNNASNTPSPPSQPSTGTMTSTSTSTSTTKGHYANGFGTGAISKNGTNGTNGSTTTTDRLIAGIFDKFPSWDMTGRSMANPPPPPPSKDNSSSSPPKEFGKNAFFGDFVMGNFCDNVNDNGDDNVIARPNKKRSNKNSSSESSNNSSITCSWCDLNATTHCIQCNELLCSGCVHQHYRISPAKTHSIVTWPTLPGCVPQVVGTFCVASGMFPQPIGTKPTNFNSGAIPKTNVKLPKPIGTSPTGAPIPTKPPSRAAADFPNDIQSEDFRYFCDMHLEHLRYVCDSCKSMICQYCTFQEHNDHNYIAVGAYVEEANERIRAALDSSRTGTKCIKNTIDKVLTCIRCVDRNFNEIIDNIHKSFRQYLLALEDRERFLVDFVEKLRQRRLTVLNDQMAGLKSALAGLAETSVMLNKVSTNSENMEETDIAIKISNGLRQLEQFAAIHQDLQPRQEVYAFVPPDYNLLQELRAQGGVVLVEDPNAPPLQNSGPLIPLQCAEMGAMALPLPGANGQTAANMQMIPVNNNGARRPPFTRENSFRSIESPLLQSLGTGVATDGYHNNNLEWERNVMRISPNLHFGAPRTTQAIPGCNELVRARHMLTPTISFATEGHDDGQVSRPWGLCVDKFGNVYISDRRNNRVQVFSLEGMLKFKFGRKGVGNGEFDLPAGICVDMDNRIIVVDKDNHRVQIFTANGLFLLKFGSYGKEYGQFQYPWDVAVNSRRQIVVTDSRNHRIQQFDSEGRFIRQVIFDNHGLNKGIASPRGVCYTPAGNIIVSDFDNHCLYLVDPDVNEVLSAKGHEGSGAQEFNRPSGICCDDDGRIIVADSKNQRIVIHSPALDYLWSIDIRPSINRLMPPTIDEKDRTCDVAVLPDGRIVFLIELSPDSKEGTSPYKRFVHIF